MLILKLAILKSCIAVFCTISRSLVDSLLHSYLAKACWLCGYVWFIDIENLEVSILIFSNYIMFSNKNGFPDIFSNCFQKFELLIFNSYPIHCGITKFQKCEAFHKKKFHGKRPKGVTMQ